MKLGRFSAIHAPAQRIYKKRAVVPVGVTISWDSTDGSGGNVYGDSSISYIEISQVSSGSTGSALDLYNAVNNGVLVVGTTVTLVTNGATINDPPTTSYLVLTSGFTYDPGLGGGGGGWTATMNTISGTANPIQGISAIFFLP
jgi:hypothetical protein